jgi:hypothetical protein
MTALDEVKSMLVEWDSGRIVWTLEMGGMGPGYEQALQICMIEICRAAIKEPRRQDETDQQYSDRFKVLRDKVVHEIDSMCGGFSGAQVGAATQLAYRFVTDGPEKAFASFKKQRPDEYGERHTMISKDWPHAPDHPVAKEKCGAASNGITTAQGKKPRRRRWWA